MKSTMKYMEVRRGNIYYDGIRNDITSKTVNDVYELWAELKRGIKDSTFKNYIYMYETFVKPTFGKKRITAVKRSDVKRFYNRLKEDRGMKISTIDNVHNVLYQVFQFAVDDDMIRANPTSKMMKELRISYGNDSEKRKALTVEQQKLFLSFLERRPQYQHWYPVFYIMLNTGMRVGEVTGLRWNDIDLENEEINVNHTLVYYNHRDEKGCYFSINTPKTKAGRRVIPMTKGVKEAFLMEKKVWWKCPVCGFEWQSLVKSRIKGTVCPVCADRAVKEGYNDLATTDPDIAAEWNTERNKGLLPCRISRNSLRYVWWKDAYGHEWRDRVFNRSVERAGCRICEEEFRMAFPRLLLSLYARRLGVQAINDGEELTGIPLENYIPDLRIAIETAERQKEEAKVKGYICEKRGIRYVWVPLRRKDSLSEYAQRMKLALQKVHVYFPSDEEQDVELLRRLFDDWRRKAEIT